MTFVSYPFLGFFALVILLNLLLTDCKNGHFSGRYMRVFRKKEFQPMCAHYLSNYSAALGWLPH